MSDHRNLPVPGEPDGGLTPYDGWQPPPPQDEEQAGGVNLKRYLAAVLRYKWIILALVAVGTVVGWYAGRFVELRYRAQATVLLGSMTAQDKGQGPIQSSDLLGGADWLSLLRSFEVLDHVAWQERLYLEYAAKDSALMRTFSIDTVFAPGEYTLRVSKDGGQVHLLTGEGLQIETVRPGEKIGVGQGFIWQPEARLLTAGRSFDFTVVTPREAAVQLGRQLGLNLPKGSTFIGISYVTNSPTAAAVVNTTVDRFIAVATELKNAKVVELRDLLAQQLIRAETNLAIADQALQAFRGQTITLPREGSPLAMTPGLAQTQAPVTNAYWQMKMQRDALNRDRERIMAALRVAEQDSLSVDALSAVPSVQQSPELNQALSALASERANIRALRQQYTDEHAQVAQARNQLTMLERQTVPELAGRVLENIESESRNLEQLISAAGSEMQDIPDRVAEEWKLQREQLSAERLYTDVRQRFETTRLATDATVPDLRVLDSASPPNRPVADPRLKMLFMGVVIALGLGLALAILLDMMDPRLRYADQVTRGLGLSVVGAVPNLATARRGQLAAPDSQKVVVEALRAVRLGLSHAHGSAGPLMVTISSPGSGDGKTFITSNLGLSFAGLGSRVLIIDGDTRRGDMHRLFGLDRKPGLTDYLAGTLDGSKLIRATKFEGLSVITSGSRRDGSPELLSSPRMSALLAQIKPQFDVILVDSPPLGAGIDPLVLGTMAGSMLLVMRTGNTERSMAQQKVEMLNRLPVRLLGAVLNGFDSVEGYQYYSYMENYETTEETDEGEKLLQPANG